jgi:hypothetical protein
VAISPVSQIDSTILLVYCMTYLIGQRSSSMWRLAVQELTGAVTCLSNKPCATSIHR